MMHLDAKRVELDRLYKLKTDWIDFRPPDRVLWNHTRPGVFWVAALFAQGVGPGFAMYFDSRGRILAADAKLFGLLPDQATLGQVAMLAAAFNLEFPRAFVRPETPLAGFTGRSASGHDLTLLGW